MKKEATVLEYNAKTLDMRTNTSATTQLIVCERVQASISVTVGGRIIKFGKVSFREGRLK